ncbi:hypothetical protein MTR_3g108510 [Medicago truncatula]|uniref:Uncharacterized protein n=1 Tax=Medicago truncatula TaxID=3880 RepID=A0A072VCR0_MEDTR|nr:hypothetical protein MTR_3g108510 [Medicago truncatula]
MNLKRIREKKEIRPGVNRKVRNREINRDLDGGGKGEQRKVDAWDERGGREEDCRDENDNNENETCIELCIGND